MKVLWLLGVLNYGGAEVRTLQLFKAIHKIDNLKLYLYVNSGEKGDLSEEFEKLNIEIIYAKKGLIGFLNLIQILRNEKINVFHCNANLAGGLFCFLAYLAGVKKRISHIRTSEDYGSGILYRFKKFFYTGVLNIFSNNIIGVSKSCLQLSSFNKDKYQTIYNGFLFKEIIKNKINNKKEANLICLGRMHPAKNQLFLIDILYELNKRFPNIEWRLGFYGKEDLIIKSQIQAEAEKKNIIHYISFNGKTDDPIQTIEKYDILLLPSIREGLPGVLLEAASINVPSVCSTLSGCVEIAEIVDSVTPISLDSKDEWIETIYQIFINDEKINNDYLKNTDFNFDNHRINILKLWGVIK